MASDVWCGGYGCREMALGRGEGALLAVPRGTERHLQGLRGGGGWYRDGHEGRRGNMGSGRPEDDKEEGEIWSPADKVPWVLAVGEGEPVGSCSTMLVEEKEEGEIWSPGDTEDAPVKGAGPSKKTATHEQLTPPSRAMTFEDTPMARKRSAVDCGRPVRRVARRTLPVKGSPIKKRKAWKQEGAELEGGGEIVEDDEAAAVRGTETTSAAAAAADGGLGKDWKGKSILPVARKRACPAVYCGRLVRRAARKTMQMDGPPLKKASPIKKRKAWKQEGAELEGGGEIVEDEAAAVRGTETAAADGGLGKDWKGEGILPVARKRACPAVYCGRPVRRAARKTMQMDGPPLKKAPSTCCHQQESTVCKGGAAGMLPQQCCRSVDAYEVLNKVGAGAYGVVFRARDRETGDVVALKKMDLDETAIREISILASLRLHHPGCIVGFRELVFDHVRGPEAGVYMVMDYAEFDLHRVIQGMKQPFDESDAKFLMHQLLQAIQCIHGCGVLHRDLKTSNVLVTPSGELKVCDFGLSRRCSGSVHDQRPYTDWVVTLWYRAPELLLKPERGYSAAIDMWSAGCIMAELLRKAPLFPGRNELDQLHEIFGVLGTPDEGTWPGFADLCAHINADFAGRQPSGDRLKENLPPLCLSEAGYDLLTGLLIYDPGRRLTAEQALNHRWFREFPPPTKLRFRC